MNWYSVIFAAAAFVSLTITVIWWWRLGKEQKRAQELANRHVATVEKNSKTATDLAAKAAAEKVRNEAKDTSKEAANGGSLADYLRDRGAGG